MPDQIYNRRIPGGTVTRKWTAGEQALIKREITRSWTSPSPQAPDAPPPPPPGSAFTGNENLTITVNRTEGIAPAGFYLVAEFSGHGLSAGPGPLSEMLGHYIKPRFKWTFDEDGRCYDRMPEKFVWDRLYAIDGTTVKWNKPGRPQDDPAYSGSTIQYLGVDKTKAYGPHTGIIFYPSPEAFAAEKAATGKDYILKTATVEVLTTRMLQNGAAPSFLTKTKRSVIFKIWNPDVEFGLQNTVYISGDGIFPPEAIHTAATYRDAWNLMTNTVYHTRVRFRWRRGEVFDARQGTAGTIRHENQFEHMMVDFYGDPNDPAPIVHYGQKLIYRAKMHAGSSVSLVGFRSIGPYDPANPNRNFLTGAVDPRACDEPGLEVDCTTNFPTIWDVHASNAAQGFAGKKDQWNLIMGNCIASDYWNYGFYSNIGINYSNWSGCQFLQKYDAIVGYQTKPTLNNPSINSGDPRALQYYPSGHSGGKFGAATPVHGAFRVSHAGKAGAGGYAGYGSHNACIVETVGGHGGGHQPGLRFGGNGENDEPMMFRTSQDRMLSLSGPTVGNGTFKGPLYPHMQVFDKIININPNTTGDGTMVGLGASGVELRNGLFILANQWFLGKPYGVAFRSDTIEDRNPLDPSCLDYEIWVRGCMALDLRDDHNLLDHPLNNGRGMTHLFLAPEFRCYSDWHHIDNIQHTPARTQTSSEGYDKSNLPMRELPQAAGMFWPGNRVIQNKDDMWNKYFPEAATQVWPANDPLYEVSSAVTLHIPEPGSPAYETGDDDLAPIDDLFGNIRPRQATHGKNPSKGPLEPMYYPAA